MFYDGDCGLCSFAVRFILKYEKASNLTFARLQSDVAGRLLPGELTGELDSVVLMENKQLYIKSNALVRISNYLKFPYNLLTVLKLIPRPMRDWLYDLVARNRHRLFKQSCLLMNEEIANRFVNE